MFPEEKDTNLHDASEKETQQSETLSGEPKPQNESIHWEEKFKQAQEQYIRLFAEFENFRKRTARERQEWHESAGKDVIFSFLSILDDLDRAMAQPITAENFEDFRKGIQLIQQRFIQLLREKSVVEMEALKQSFDPERHEAITHIPAVSDEDKGKIVDVIEKGYLMGEKVLRFPKVVVGS